MKLEEVIKRKGKRTDNTVISIRIPKTASVFMSKKNISPTALFMKALEELGYSKEELAI